MRAGLLRHRITIQFNTPTQNDFDEWVDSWSDWATVWASIEPLRGKSYFEAKQANSEVEGLIRIRYRGEGSMEFPYTFPITFGGIRPTMRIKFGDRYFNIISVIQPFERKRELNLLYKEELD